MRRIHTGQAIEHGRQDDDADRRREMRDNKHVLALPIARTERSVRWQEAIREIVDLLHADNHRAHLFSLIR